MVQPTSLKKGHSLVGRNLLPALVKVLVGWDDSFESLCILLRNTILVANEVGHPTGQVLKVSFSFLFRLQSAIIRNRRRADWFSAAEAK